METNTPGEVRKIENIAFIKASISELQKTVDRVSTEDKERAVRLESELRQNTDRLNSIDSHLSTINSNIATLVELERKRQESELKRAEDERQRAERNAEVQSKILSGMAGALQGRADGETEDKKEARVRRQELWAALKGPLIKLILTLITIATIGLTVLAASYGIQIKGEENVAEEAEQAGIKDATEDTEVIEPRGEEDGDTGGEREQ